MVLKGALFPTPKFETIFQKQLACGGFFKTQRNSLTRLFPLEFESLIYYSISYEKLQRKYILQARL